MYETFLIAQERTKGKKNMPTIIAIETEEILDEVYVALTRSQTQFRRTPLNGPPSGPSKANFNDKFIPKPTLPETRVAPIFEPLNTGVTQSVGLSGYTPYNVTAELENLKANISFVDVLRAPKKLQN